MGLQASGTGTNEEGGGMTTDDRERLEAIATYGHSGRTPATAADLDPIGVALAEVDRLTAELAAARADERKAVVEEIAIEIERRFGGNPRGVVSGTMMHAVEIARSIGSKPRPDAGEGGEES